MVGRSRPTSSAFTRRLGASPSHLDLHNDPYNLYGGVEVKYIDPVSLTPLSGPTLMRAGTMTRSKASPPQLDLARAPYVLYGVEYIDLVSLAHFAGRASAHDNIFSFLGASLFGNVLWFLGLIDIDHHLFFKWCQ